MHAKPPFRLIAALIFSTTLAQAQNTFPTTGSVGIGTTTPGATLHLLATTPSLMLQESAGRTFSLSSRWGGYFTIFDEGDTSFVRFAIGATGNVGVGTLFPAGKLTVATQDSYGGTSLRLESRAEPNRYSLSYSSDVIGPGVVGWSLNQVNDSVLIPNVLRFDRGKIGLGTASPAASLDIWKPYSAGTDAIRISYSDGNAYWLGIQSYVVGPGDVGYKFRTNNGAVTTNGFVITGAGSVGIGTTNPLRSLGINGGIMFQTPGGAARSIHWADETTANAPVLISANTTAGNESLTFSTNSFGSWGIERMRITASGNVGIGTSNPTQKLSVNGTIRAKEVIVDTGWSDYVFADDYALAPLSVVEAHIKSEKHLPGIPSASEVAEHGISVGDMQAKLLAKIEELTLHVIAQQKEVFAMKAENAELRREVELIKQSAWK